MRKCYVATLGLALLLAGAAAAVEPGEKAPEFERPDLDTGAPVSLEAYRGKIVYLDFWASWCPPCQVSLPQLDALQDELGGDLFQVVAVNVDQDPRKAMRILAQMGLSYPSASDPEMSLPEAYGLETMPTSYLIDGDGVVRYVHHGFRDGDLEQVRPIIRDLLRAHPASPAR